MKLKMKVLLAAYKKESEKKNYSIYVDDPNIDLECCAYLYPTVYEKIFRKKKKEASQSDQRLSIMKIKNSNRCIYRKYTGKSVDGLTQDYIVISGNSKQQLKFDEGKENIVTVSKGCWLPFYWYHSNSATRMSFRIGMLGFATGLTGIILSIIF